MESYIRPELIEFQGVSMIDSFINDWENIQNFKTRPDDILVATYPKAGALHKVDILFAFKKICKKEELIGRLISIVT